MSTRAFLLLAVLSLPLAATQAFGVDTQRLKWITSIYADGTGIGLKYPEGVACGQDHFVVADTGNSRLLRYSYQNQTVAPDATFPLPKTSPLIVQVNSKGDLYYLEGRGRRIDVISGTGEARGSLTLQGLPTKIRMVPRSFRIDSNDNIYILDIFSERVLVLDPEGRYLRHVSFPTEYGFLSDLEVDLQGSIFLVDSVEAVVYSAARNAEEFSQLTETMKEYMNFPTGLALDNRGTIYLVDQYGGGLALISRDGSFLGRKLGMGWNESFLYYPAQICIDSDGNVLIADRNNSRVQLFTLSEK